MSKTSVGPYEIEVKGPDSDEFQREFERTFGFGYPRCEKCGKPVALFKMENPVRLSDVPGELAARATRTGEVILTIECHGARWHWSNFRGVTSDDPP